MQPLQTRSRAGTILKSLDKGGMQENNRILHKYLHILSRKPKEKPHENCE